MQTEFQPTSAPGMLLATRAGEACAGESLRPPLSYPRPRWASAFACLPRAGKRACKHSALAVACASAHSALDSRRWRKLVRRTSRHRSKPPTPAWGLARPHHDALRRTSSRRPLVRSSASRSLLAYDPSIVPARPCPAARPLISHHTAAAALPVASFHSQYITGARPAPLATALQPVPVAPASPLPLTGQGAALAIPSSALFPPNRLRTPHSSPSFIASSSSIWSHGPRLHG
ncbi:hypothetical protein BDY17DRAFT_117279 [Neohortaea acidophila]|uniref:Uncharacterized protein n=1 Tax=Neohortaea acidophila TaxID=245834 RepID=A0A6A6PVT9_9PEZI|nr:uncharacterized protein BDY17DRAFT_117279 [Neohortaea acidophila]KAF2483886.1 hypothetical protein BDY17DRAFT_117279 [Neohortaea acidophila]